MKTISTAIGAFFILSVGALALAFLATEISKAIEEGRLEARREFVEEYPQHRDLISERGR